jgi:SpoVK/Ycf46/Vps4 family AAA+-type ATPase
MDGLSVPKILLLLGQQIDRQLLICVNRPGRFDKVIYLDLPAKRKRFELFKFYSQVA